MLIWPPGGVAGISRRTAIFGSKKNLLIQVKLVDINSSGLVRFNLRMTEYGHSHRPLVSVVSNLANTYMLSGTLFMKPYFNCL